MRLELEHFALALLTVMGLFVVGLILIWPNRFFSQYESEVPCKMFGAQTERVQEGKISNDRLIVGFICGDKVASVKFDKLTPGVINGEQTLYQQQYRGLIYRDTIFYYVTK